MAPTFETAFIQATTGFIRANAIASIEPALDGKARVYLAGDEDPYTVSLADLSRPLSIRQVADIAAGGQGLEF